MLARGDGPRRTSTPEITGKTRAGDIRHYFADISQGASANSASARDATSPKAWPNWPNGWPGRRRRTASPRRGANSKREGWWHERSRSRRADPRHRRRGFIGSNLADRWPAKAIASSCWTSLRGRARNATAAGCAKRHGRAHHVRGRGDIRDAARVGAAVARGEAVFPSRRAGRRDHEPRRSRAKISSVNVGGTFELLEALRPTAPHDARSCSPPPTRSMAILATLRSRATDERLSAGATRRCARDGVSETRPLDFHTPYGCSKGAADQYVLDYAQQLRACRPPSCA